MYNKFFENTNNYIKTKIAYDKIINLLKDGELNKNELKNIKKEILPIIIASKYLKYRDIKFVGKEGNSIDAIFKNDDYDFLNIECTTSIDFGTQELIGEYTKEYGSCFITPRTKAVNTVETDNHSDICYSGTKNKRTFIEQPDILSLSTDEIAKHGRNGLIDSNLINQYAQIDINAIHNKIRKGLEHNLYKDFMLVLSTEHKIHIGQVPEYQKLILAYWENISNKTFNRLFVVNYDNILYQEVNDNICEYLFCAPVPIIYIDYSK